MMWKLAYLLTLFLLTGCGPEPSINILGVEEGEIYPTIRVINIDEVAAGTYMMKLNGKDIKNGHRVAENGNYELTIEARRWWNVQTKTINFEIDNEPPNIILDYDIRPSYLNEVKFVLEKEEGVTYQITVNGEPFDIKEFYKAEGTHTLLIKALKDNGLIKHREVTFTIDNRTYSRKMIDKFKDFIYNIEDRDDPELMKWANDVAVYVHGSPTHTDLKVMRQYLEEINEMIPVDFILKESSKEHNVLGNRLDVYFVPTWKFKEHGYSGALRSGNTRVVGFATPTHVTSWHEIKKSKIVIGTDTEQQGRKSTILHEIIHALGFYNHFEDDKTSILHPYIGVRGLSESDKKLIDILYREDIRPGMSHTDIEWVLEPRIVN